MMDANSKQYTKKDSSSLDDEPLPKLTKTSMYQNEHINNLKQRLKKMQKCRTNSHNNDDMPHKISTIENSTSPKRSEEVLEDSTMVQCLQYLRTIDVQNSLIIKQNTQLTEQNDALIKQNARISQQNELLLAEFALKTEKVQIELSENLLEPIFGFPLKTVQQFHDLNENKEKRNELFSHLIRLGGSKLRQYLSSALKATMTDELVCHFTWFGGSCSQKFGNTKVANLLFHAAERSLKRFGPISIKAFQDELSEVMRCAKQRHKNNMKKTKLNPNEEFEHSQTTHDALEELKELREPEKVQESVENVEIKDELILGDETDFAYEDSYTSQQSF